jgi:uncharacterized protein (DUF58 family)
MQQARRIELRTWGLVESLFSGEYHSIFKGRGLEFSDVREYQPGDDVRSIDWNVTARRGRPFIKEYVEERELTALLIVDLSASKECGTGARSNAHIVVEIAAILALSAARNNDRVGLLIVTDRVEFFIPPDTGRRHALRLLLELLAFRPEGRGTRLSTALEYAARVLRQRATVFLISDYVMDGTTDPEFEPLARRFSLQHDLVPVRLTDPASLTLPNLGLVAFVDPESGRRRVVNSSDSRTRERYRVGVTEQRRAMDVVFRDLRLDVADVSATEDFVLELIGFFRRRERVLR